jgi:hypothetical protein
MHYADWLELTTHYNPERKNKYEDN